MIEIIQTDFSPNNDGLNDLLTINYKMSNPGNSISIYAFNFNGMMVRKIVDNQLCGTSGTFIWDGLNQHKQRVNPGVYIIFAEILDLRGKQMKFKKAIALD
jgi:flagellar hook assembly protein FlgD